MTLLVLGSIVKGPRGPVIDMALIACANLSLSSMCVFHYKWFYKGKYIEAKNQYSYRWNDPKINIKWPIKKPILSKRDQNSKLI